MSTLGGMVNLEDRSKSIFGLAYSREIIDFPLTDIVPHMRVKQIPKSSRTP